MNTDRLLSIPAEEYHAASRSGQYMSSHLLADFRESPELYRRKTNGEIAETESPALALGRAAHCLILEGKAAFDEQHVVADGPVNPKTGEPYGKSTKAYAEWLSSKGKWVGGNVALGYKVENHRLVVVPEEAETVRFIFRRFIESASLKEIGRELEERGIRPKLGKAWNTQMLYRLLTNYVYVGKVKYRNQVVEGEHDAIVSEAQWETVQSMMEDRAPVKDGERRTETAAPLKGILKCGHCGGALSPVWCTRGRRRYFYYKCLVDSRRAIPSCPVRQVAAGEVEGLVYRQLQLVLGSPEIQAAVAEVSGLPASDVATFLGSELWERMTMPERGRLARLLVKEAVLREDGLTMEIRTEGIEALIKEALDETQN